MKRIAGIFVLTVFLLTIAAAGVIPAENTVQGALIASYREARPDDTGRIDIVHTVNTVKPTGKSDPGYKLMGVKWNPADLPVDYAVNPANDDGLAANFVLSTMEASTETWDAVVVDTNIFDIPTIDSTASYGSTPGKNEVSFGVYDGNSGVIAVTSVWYNRRTREIVEFDMLFNTYYSWGDATATAAQVMDLQNIAVHEFGHSVGLADVYSTSFAENTMYGYANYNQTNKRSLEDADIAGIRKLYGP